MARHFFQGLAIVVGACLFLTGCGLQPMLATPAPQSNPQKFILKVFGSGHGAYKMRRELEKRLAALPKRSDCPYTIEVSFGESTTSMGYGKDATVLRSQTTATGIFKVIHGGQVIGSGTAEGISSYSLNYAEEFSTRSAMSAAQDRASIILAEELINEILMAISAPKKLIPVEKIAPVTIDPS